MSTVMCLVVGDFFTVVFFSRLFTSFSEASRIGVTKRHNSGNRCNRNQPKGTLPDVEPAHEGGPTIQLEHKKKKKNWSTRTRPQAALSATE